MRPSCCSDACKAEIGWRGRGGRRWRGGRVPEGDLGRASLTSCCLKQDTRAPLLPSTWIAYLIHTLLHTHTHAHTDANANSVLFFTLTVHRSRAHCGWLHTVHFLLPASYELHQEISRLWRCVDCPLFWQSVYSRTPTVQNMSPWKESSFVPTAWKQSCCSENSHTLASSWVFGLDIWSKARKKRTPADPAPWTGRQSVWSYVWLFLG